MKLFFFERSFIFELPFKLIHSELKIQVYPPLPHLIILKILAYLNPNMKGGCTAEANLFHHPPVPVITAVISDWLGATFGDMLFQKKIRQYFEE
jgi:hypothetical protein